MEEYTGAVRRIYRWRNILEQWGGSIDGGIYWSSEVRRRNIM